MALTRLQPSSRTSLLLLLLLPLFLLGPRLAAAEGPFAGKDLVEIFWQLNYTDTRTDSRAYLGGQNITTCCNKAIKENYHVVDGHIQRISNYSAWIEIPKNRSYDYPLDMLSNYSTRGQFPCTAVYDGDIEGAPVVFVDYVWMSVNCPGWQLSNTENLNSWLQPLSGFLVPAVIFCLSVPRRRKFEVPRALFAADQAGIMNYLLAPLGAMVALVMVSADTILWLCTCLAFAGPMIISGLYEAMLDNRVVEYLRLKISEQHLTLDMRCRCLMVILIGNLDLVWNPDTEGGSGGYVDNDKVELQYSDAEEGNPEFQHLRSNSTEEPLMGSHHADWIQLSFPQDQNTVPQVQVTPPEPTESTESTDEVRPENSPTAGPSVIKSGESTAADSISIEIDRETESIPNGKYRNGTLASPWLHMEEFLYSLRLYDDDILSRGHSPRQYARHLPLEQREECNNDMHYEKPIARTSEIKSEILQMKTRLKTMLQCQYSFGSMVGAPVIFFLGGFIFTLLQSLDTLGVEDIAIGLAFGQWFMIIPHVAIVSGLLLAGNNPNILEGVLAVDHKYDHDDITFLGLTYGLAYPSCYKVAWIWNRGHNKKQWLNTLIDTYLKRRDVGYRTDLEHEKHIDKDIFDLKKATTLSLRDWIGLLFLTMALLYTPFVLAFLTAYYTPEIGLSCRTITFTIYACTQTGQIILWLWAYAGPLATFDMDRRTVSYRGGWLAHHGFFRPYSLRWLVEGGGPVPRNPLRLLQLLTQNPRRLICWPFVWNVLYYTNQWVLGLIGIMASIGGTLMQLMGVYSAEICYVTTNFWFVPPEKRAKPAISLNSNEMIRQSIRTWKPCAIAAIVFMGVVSFIGWWYQRRMRDLFTDQVSRIDVNERRDTRQSRVDGDNMSLRMSSDMTSRTILSIPAATRSRTTSYGSTTPLPAGTYYRTRSNTVGTISQTG